VNLLNLAESVVYANIASEAMFNVNAYQFLRGTSAHGSRGITLKELINSAQGGSGGVALATAQAGGFAQNAFGAVGKNLQDNAVEAAFKMVGAGIGFKIAKRLTSKPRTQLNKLLKMGGLGSSVRV
jgi:hypothetical protein